MAVNLATAQADAQGMKREWAQQAKERADYLDVFWQPGSNGLIAEPVLKRGHLGQETRSQTDVEPKNITEWLDATPRERPPSTGSLRMIVLDRHRYAAEYPVTEITFNNIIDKLKLSKRTWASFDCDAGTFSRSYRYDDVAKPDEITGINIIMKAPQKRETGNCGLSLHYNFSTKETTGLLFGTDFIVCRDEEDDPPENTKVIPGHPNLIMPSELSGPGKSLQRAKWCFDNIHRQNELEPSKNHHQRARPTLWKMIETNKARLNHPLAVPCMFLEEHLKLNQEYCEHGKVSEETWEIMNELGMRSDDHSQDGLFWTKAMGARNAYTAQGATDRFNAEKITARLDRQALRLLFTLRGPEWNKNCSEFALKIASELSKRLPPLPVPATDPNAQASSRPRYFGRFHDELKDGLEYNVQMSEALTSRLTTMKENMTMQLDVCAAITGQASNEFNARIAWDTSRDSTSMKILAVITAFFLPGTFVATFMSMGIWNWQWTDTTSNNANPGVVSPHWVIYIEAAIPLTLATIIGWIGWWIYEIIVRENNYMKTMPGDMGGSTTELLVRRILKRVRDLRVSARNQKGWPPLKWWRAHREVQKVRRIEKDKLKLKQMDEVSNWKKEEEDAWNERQKLVSKTRATNNAQQAPSSQSSGQSSGVSTQGAKAAHGSGWCCAV